MPLIPSSRSIATQSIPLFLLLQQFLKKGIYDPMKLFGVPMLDIVGANSFVVEKKNLNLIDVDAPVIAGHAGITILPLLSKTRPLVKLTDEKVEEHTLRIQNAGTEVVEAKDGAGSATLSMAYVTAKFVESDLTDFPFFASTDKLGKKGVEAVIGKDLQGITELEAKGLEALIEELKGSIEKGVGFVQKQAITSAN